MKSNAQFLHVVPVLPSIDVIRDVEWYKKQAGFESVYTDKMYAVIRRENIYLHLQWHADTVDDPLLGGSVIRILVKTLEPIFKEFVKRGTIQPEKLVLNT